MAYDAFLHLRDYNNNMLEGESPVDPIPGTPNTGGKRPTEVTEFTFGIAQTLNIGSQSTGAGAGKVQFNAFTFKIPASSKILPGLQTACANGKPYKNAYLLLRKQGGGGPTGNGTDLTNYFLMYTFGLFAIATIDIAGGGDETPMATITAEYGGLHTRLQLYGADGRPVAGAVGAPSSGWNRVKNVAWDDPNVVIQ